MIAQAPHARPPLAVLLKRLAQIAMLVVVQGLVLFLSAGHAGWLEAWVYIAVYVGCVAAAATLLLRRNPGVIAERAEVRPGTKGWDWVVATAYGLVSLGVLAVAGLDERNGWSRPPATALQAVGLLATVGGYALFIWGMASNPFFSSVVRIQRERGHQVVSSGPYAYARHPGYAGMTVLMLGLPLLLASWWAYVPAVVASVLLALRAALEDRTLAAELPGYRDYAARVRARFLPGIW